MSIDWDAYDVGHRALELACDADKRRHYATAAALADIIRIEPLGPFLLIPTGETRHHG